MRTHIVAEAGVAGAGASVESCCAWSSGSLVTYRQTDRRQASVRVAAVATSVRVAAVAAVACYSCRDRHSLAFRAFS